VASIDVRAALPNQLVVPVARAWGVRHGTAYVLLGVAA
jgi:hypothetical protein